jgi:septum formation protein
MAVFRDISDDVIVIGSDTVVVQDGVIYGKPKDYNDAVRMLKTLSDNQHEVLSSLCLLIRKNGIEYEELTYDKAIVYVDKLSMSDIDSWINSNDVYSKAGAYAIQEGFGKHIKKIDGDYFSIIGLPINKLNNLLKKYL